MMNVAVFHLLAAPASIALNIGLLGFLVPLALSISFITFLWIRAIKIKEQAPWFVAAHWRLEVNIMMNIRSGAWSKALTG